jgi:hypothetical protein
MDHYQEYGCVEKHIRYAKRLQSISEKGKRFLNEIETKKRVGGRKKYQGDTYFVYNLLENIVKPRIVLCNNLYSSLLFYLDEMLFYEVRGINSFVIEDDTFPLSFIYFNQCEWNPDVGQTHEFCLDNEPLLSDTEAALLGTLLRDYETFLQDILQDLIASKAPIRKERIYIKLIRVMNRLKRRLRILTHIIATVLQESNFEKN